MAQRLGIAAALLGDPATVVLADPDDAGVRAEAAARPVGKAATLTAASVPPACTLLRSTAGGISVLFGVLFALAIVAGFLPGSLSGQVSKFLPGGDGLGSASSALTPPSCWPSPPSACGAATPNPRR